MMPIDLTVQFAPILDGMVLLLIAAAAGLVIDAVRGTTSRRSQPADAGRGWSAPSKPLRV